MSRLSNLLRQVEKQDRQLAADLKREVDALSGRRSFGLNFERHIPETVELPGRPVRRGDKVRFLSRRGEKPSGADRRLWRVSRIRRIAGGKRVADLVPHQDKQASTTSRPVEDLVVVAEFRDPVFPGLVSTGKVERGGDRPFHTVINAENFHALQVLLYTHEGRVDAIYIDPPYNSGARDWKYNNDYVDSEDAYRHSKWLAMMERRLKLAKRLLNPDNSVLIVTIDEKEYLRLGLLLKQVFEASRVQMVSITMSPRGTNRTSEFSRVDEYAFFVFLGSAAVQATAPLDGDEQEVRWQYLRRGQKTLVRGSRPNQFYPIYVDIQPSGVHGRPGIASLRPTASRALRGPLNGFPGAFAGVVRHRSGGRRRRVSDTSATGLSDAAKGRGASLPFVGTKGLTRGVPLRSPKRSRADARSSRATASPRACIGAPR